MKDEFELKIAADGTIETIYQDGIEKFAEEMGAEVSTVCRASEVEWEEAVEKKGWTVRSAKDPKLALRCTVAGSHAGTVDLRCSRTGYLHFFETRAEAIDAEIKFFWELRNG